MAAATQALSGRILIIAVGALGDCAPLPAARLKSPPANGKRKIIWESRSIADLASD
jgi:hypothetical protein